MIHVLAGRERSIKSVAVESKNFLHSPYIRVIILADILILIRDTRMIHEILKTENNKEK